MTGSPFDALVPPPVVPEAPAPPEDPVFHEDWPFLLMTKRGRDFDGVIWEMELYFGCLLFGVSTLVFCIRICALFYGHVLCSMYLVLRLAWTSVHVWTYFCYDIYLYLCSWCMWYMWCVSSSFTIHPSTTCNWRLEVNLDGWRVTVCAYTFISQYPCYA